MTDVVFSLLTLLMSSKVRWMRCSFSAGLNEVLMCCSVSMPSL